MLKIAIQLKDVGGNNKKKLSFVISTYIRNAISNKDSTKRKSGLQLPKLYGRT